MGFLDNVLMALASIKANRLRSFLTMLGIIIGISSVITIMTIGDSLQGSVSGQLANFGAMDVEVTIVKKEEADIESDDPFVFFDNSVDPKELTDRDLISNEMLEELKKTYPDKVEYISLDENLGADSISMNGGTANVMMIACSPEFHQLHQLQMIAGRFVNETDIENKAKVAVVSSLFVEKILGNDVDNAIGKTVNVKVNGYTREVMIIGVYKKQDWVSAVNVENPQTNMYFPISTGKMMLGKIDGYNYLSVRAKPLVDIEEFTKDLNTFFGRYYRYNEKYTTKATNMMNMLKSMNDVMAKITLAISGIAAISLLVGGIGVMNIMLVSITERTKEIGTRKALGATGFNIRMQFITESVILCLVGGAIGILLGTMNGMLAAKAMQFAARPSIKAIVISVGFSMAIGVFFGFYPANKAAKMNPIDALRYE